MSSDVDGDQSDPQPLGSPACLENGASADVHAFATGISFTTMSSAEIAFTVTAAAAVDAGVGTEYEGGRAGWKLGIRIDAAAGQPWQLTLEQSIRGLLAVDDDGVGYASARIGPQVGLRIDGTPYLFSVSPATLFSSPGQLGIFDRSFTGSRIDVMTGSGPTTLTLETDVLLEVYSSCETGSPPVCTADADEAGVLLGFRDVDGLADPDVDRYLRWARAYRPDGYRVRITFQTP